jgi:hypothetical protein
MPSAPARWRARQTPVHAFERRPAHAIREHALFKARALEYDAAAWSLMARVSVPLHPGEPACPTRF